MWVSQFINCNLLCNNGYVGKNGETKYGVQKCNEIVH